MEISVVGIIIILVLVIGIVYFTNRLVVSPPTRNIIYGALLIIAVLVLLHFLGVFGHGTVLRI